MKTAKELYGDSDDWYDYQPMLEEFGQIILQVDDKDYQGDSRVIYQDEEKFGYLIFGWGSCAGCDALQACDNIEDVQELMDELFNKIHWFESLTALQEYFRNKDWELEYCWHCEETQKFIEQVANIG
jgi:hypothetical protein